MTVPPAAMAHRHFHTVDLVRGLAAFSVLIYHYYHFYIARPDAAFPPERRRAEPLYALLGPLYEHGNLAVQFFWVVSGFVFAAVYARSATTTRAFAINRVARLYPLHLLTLLVVLALQLASLGLVGHAQIYGDLSRHAFVLQLFMASNWANQDHFTFDGPIWSVSVEILFYALFWAVRPWLFGRGVVRPLLLAGGFWVLAFLLVPGWSMGFQCGCLFFGGTAIFACAGAVGFARRPLLGAALIAGALGWAAVRLAPAHPLAFAVPLGTAALLLAALALEHDLIHVATRRLRWIGDATYGVYLWHVPLQIAALIVLDRWVGSRAVVGSPWFLLGFVAVTAGLARWSFVRFEAPMRRVVRRLDGPRAAAA